ncbi:hypothetical protein MPOCJGCO_4550 [Methylobacterium trifolii]|uniref:DUF2531 family protein n=1 Tax=Methylobacterium trifolii TaxID=1003092 RepID=A0ABQ4U5I6_9HYPH|nr:hypothetical protein MPOCJGCO_4550 [Methylobacterium trifolii]
MNEGAAVQQANKIDLVVDIVTETKVMRPGLPLRQSRTRHRPVHRARAALILIPFTLILAVVLVPEGRLACAEPVARETSPDGAWTLTLCSRPMWFAMPGGSSDAPGWIVLRDRTGAIRGVTGLGMVQMYGGETIWLPEKVARSLVTEMPLPRTRSAPRVWIEDRLWRLRALLGLTRTDDAFH